MKKKTLSDGSWRNASVAKHQVLGWWWLTDRQTELQCLRLYCNHTTTTMMMMMPMADDGRWSCSLAAHDERALPSPTHSPTHPTTVISCCCILVVEFIWFFVGVHVLHFQELSGSLLPPVLHFFFGDFHRFCVLCPIFDITPFSSSSSSSSVVAGFEFHTDKSSSVFLLDSLSLFCLSSVFFLFLRCEVQWGFLRRSFVVSFQQAQDRVVGLLLWSSLCFLCSFRP